VDWTGGIELSILKNWSLSLTRTNRNWRLQIFIHKIHKN